MKGEIKNRDKSKVPIDDTFSPIEHPRQQSSSNRKKYFIIFALFISSVIFLYISLNAEYEEQEKEEMIMIEKLLHFQIAKVFSSNMVLPRAPKTAKIWGWCDDPNCVISVLFNGETYKSTVETIYEAEGEKFEWEISLPPTPAGGPYILEFTDGKGRIEFKNVLFGDIYLCSGEGNMQQTVHQTFHGEREINRSSNYLRIRLFTVENSHSPYELKDFHDVTQRWTMSTPESLGNKKRFSYFSSVCWHFGRNFYERYKIPVGLISSTYFGAPIQGWVPKDKKHECLSSEPKINLHEIPTDAGRIFNYLVAPIKEYGVTAVLWYQGESNIHDYNYYQCAFPSMVEGWRKEFQNPILPFFYVNLHPYLVSDIDTSLSQFRLLQSSFVHTVKYVFMVAATDLGDLLSPYEPLYPRNKEDIGKRFAISVSAHLYGSGEIHTGPIPIEAESAISDPSPLITTRTFRIKVVFQKSTIGDTLVMTDAVCPEGANLDLFCGKQYEVQFNDGIWVEVYSSEVYQKHQLHLLANYTPSAYPINLRYGYSDWPVCNLFNSDRLPLSPFQMKVSRGHH